MTDNDGEVVSSQLVPLPDQMMSLPEYEDDVTHELVFRTLTPPMSVSTYHVTRTDVSVTHSNVLTINKHKKMTLGKNKLKIVIEHGSTEVYYQDLDNGFEIPANIEMLYYSGHRGNNSEFDFRASGAYIFRPDGDDAISFGQPTQTVVTEGSVVDEVFRTFSEPWITQIIRCVR